MNKNGLSLELSFSSSLVKPIPKTDNADRKNQQKKVPFYENHGDEKSDCMCGYTGRHVYFEGFDFFFCSHARIDSHIEPAAGRETEK